MFRRPRFKTLFASGLPPKILVVGILFVLFYTRPIWAIQEGTVTPQIEVSLGFDGQAKLGCWQPFVIKTPDSVHPHQFQMTVFDGDDTPITYRGKLNPIGSELNHFQGWLKIGRAYGNAKLQLFDVHETPLAETEIPLTSSTVSGTIHRSTKRVVLTLEQGNRIADSIESSSQVIDGENEEVAICIRTAEDLPANWFCYDGIDTIIVATSDDVLMQQIGESQWQAIAQWVRNGGKLIVSASTENTLIDSESALSRFCPGNYVGKGQMQNSGKLESFASVGEQLILRGDQPIPISKIDEPEGSILLSQDGQPLIIKKSFGMGQMTFVAFDLENDRIQSWDGYDNLINRLATTTGSQDSLTPPTSETLGGSVSHYGYTDITGQLRLALDRFSKVGFISFTWVAVLIGVYILLIGPADYFILRKLFGKMELTWITFPAISILFCVLAVLVSRYSRPDSIQINQLEIIDIDAESKWVRGAFWSNLYSPYAGSIDVSTSENNSLGIDVDSALVSWQGLPGEGLGGMQSRRATGLVQPGYQQLTEVSDDQTGMTVSSMQDMPIYVSATKAIVSFWNGEFANAIRSRLVFSPRSTRLEGTLTNPLDQPLTEVRLFFQNYAYVLRKPELEPGETIDILSEMKERTARSLLTRRTKKSEKDNRSHNIPWNPTDTRISRIANMMMFFDVAGGGNYTGLTHDYQDFVDLTDKLDLGKAVLVGQVDSVGTRLKIDGQSSESYYDRSSTVVRIVLPVEFPQKK